MDFLLDALMSSHHFFNRSIFNGTSDLPPLCFHNIDILFADLYNKVRIIVRNIAICIYIIKLEMNCQNSF